MAGEFLQAGQGKRGSPASNVDHTQRAGEALLGHHLDLRHPRPHGLRGCISQEGVIGENDQRARIAADFTAMTYRAFSR
jgi:hypothetical protein